MNILNLKDKEFDLFGSTWTIKYVDHIDGEGEDWCQGKTVGSGNTIYINTKKEDGTDETKEELTLSFLHELVHSMLITCQYLSCSKNEPLVEWIARCINSLKKQNIL